MRERVSRRVMETVVTSNGPARSHYSGIKEYLRCQKSGTCCLALTTEGEHEDDNTKWNERRGLCFLYEVSITPGFTRKKLFIEKRF